ncbi:OmpA family protein [Flavobacterium granuli]|uniref:Outer membrane protein OmpA-like peptidoglycan-associated protein n=1 Tax=Flavobacterium granuli TaxID=280093 RepID=A0ABU1S2P9_9FLAO|nr:OmpA family protein [Flavobacterium granuli]MDR6845312.1 outer membrane protein OmpA-like peptidoglycan-associated protein [Flavobacterium granuli]
MRKLILLFVLACSFQKMHSQQIYLKTGRNYTDFNYKSDAGSNTNLQAGTGSFYEVGYSILLKQGSLKYNIGLSLNQYNAIESTSSNSYSWNTEYAGIENSLTYSFVKTKGFELGVNGGLGIATIVYGKQQINGAYLDLMSQKEFSGLLLSPKAGLQASYNVNKDVFFSLGYYFSKGFNVTNSTDEKLSFNTHQIQLGIHIQMNQSGGAHTKTVVAAPEPVAVVPAETPAPAPVAVVAPEVIDVEGTNKKVNEMLNKYAVNFDLNKDVLSKEAQENIDKNISTMNQFQVVKITITGYCDDSGPAEFNNMLSKKRAESVKNYLVSKGLPAERFEAIGLGIIPNTTPWSRAQNRRVVFSVLLTEEAIGEVKNQ